MASGTGKGRSDHDCPYNDLPEHAFFRNAVLRQGNLAPAPRPHFQLTSESRVVSAGSCFAARIAAFIQKSGVNYLKTEDRATADETIVREESENLFSLRYGNIYTARHLLQLLQRAAGQLVVDPPVAVDKNGRYRNLFRPSVLSYASVEALRADDTNHLRNVLALLQQADLFMFTLGLSEQWVDRISGLSLPSTPGCGYGEYNKNIHFFHNSTLDEVREELLAVFALLQSINPRLKILLTLSPVPLVATYEQTSAVEATFYSKSLLRQAIDGAVKAWPQANVTYFPSYEIITNPHVINDNFESDMRAISEAGVARVMAHFRTCFLTGDTVEPQAAAENVAPAATGFKPFVMKNEAAADVDPVCDEENIWTAYLNKGHSPE
jgi:hypothetical protein